MGNIPAGEKVVVKLTYIGELRHDIGANGFRFTLPTKISPRFSPSQVETTEQSSTISAGKFAITVDLKMEVETPLQKIQSPSHPIVVALGRTSVAMSDHYNPSQASVALSLESAALEKDFILEIIYKDSSKPRALLETHPSMTGQRALMTTLVPRTPFQTSKPEIIFVADQSGSMRGARTQTLVAALKVFLKSLPVGIKFNICYFGSSPNLLFDKSQEYNQETLQRALESLRGLDGHNGGTETLSAVKASIESRHFDENLSMILATDGDIWQQQELFDYLNLSVSQSKRCLRVFALGIGDSVSSALIEGVARAGNGFAQSVADGEKLESKVIRMLKGALTPDSGAYTLEIQYEKDDEDDFVMVERVIDSLRVLMIDDGNLPDKQLQRELSTSTLAAICSDEADADIRKPDDDQASFEYLPNIAPPKLLQTPQAVPPLYPLNRTTVYILMSPDTAHRTPKTVILRNNAPNEPFEMEIPVEILSEPSQTIHQLAAKKAISELEGGRGWLNHAKTMDGALLKEHHSSQFLLLVEREAIRLGIQHQIASKHTSFVAISSNHADDPTSIPPDTSLEIQITKASPQSPSRLRYPAALSAPSTTRTHNRTNLPPRKSTGGQPPRKQLASMAVRRCTSSTDSVLPPPPPQTKKRKATHLLQQLRSSLSTRSATSSTTDTSMSDDQDTPAEEETSTLQKLIALQTFEGYWDFSPSLLDIINISPDNHKPPEGLHMRLWATMLAVVFLERKMAAEKEMWEMVGEKARGWLSGSMGLESERKVEGWWIDAGVLVGG